MSIIIDLINKELKNRDLSTYWLADKTGLSQSKVARVLAGKRVRSQTDAINALAEALGIAVNDPDSALKQNLSSTIKALLSEASVSDLKKIVNMLTATDSDESPPLAKPQPPPEAKVSNG